MGRLIKGLAFDGQVRVLAIDSTDIVFFILNIIKINSGIILGIFLRKTNYSLLINNGEERKRNLG